MLVLYSLLVVLFVLYLYVQRKFYWLAWKIRGPIGLPFIGCIGLLSPRNILAYGAKVRKSYNSPLTLWLGPVCVLYIGDPVYAERILTASECINKSVLYDYISRFLGNGLITIKNPEWSYHRKLLNPAFKTQQLIQLVSAFNAKTKELCEQLKECSHLKRPLGVDHILQDYILSISQGSIMGQKNGVEHGKRDELAKSCNLLIESVSKMIFNPLYQSPFITRVIDRDHHNKIQNAVQITTEFVNECVEATSNSKVYPEVGLEPLCPTEYSVISHVVELNRRGLFSKDEVIDEIKHIVIASYDTTSKALLHIVTLLAMHPKWQEKLYEELEERFPDKDAELTFENIQDTPLTDMIIKETLRLFPVVPLTARVTRSDFILFDDVVIPKGTNIALDIYFMHRDPKYWGADAMHFNPYRFLQDESAQRHPFVYIPFSKGMRNCIGRRYANLAMKVFIVKVFQRFRFATTLTPDELDMTFNISAKLTQQPLFTIIERSS